MKIAPRHDFTLKLRQESLLPNVLNYVTWQRAVRDAKVRGVETPSMPNNISLISMNLDLTTACNYRCDHCIDFAILNSSMRYEHDKLMASLGDLIDKGLRSVILIGGGEPTLYPGFSETVRFLKKRGVHVAIVSNGSRNEVIHEVADVLTKHDWVRLSLDSGTDETFQKMHKPRRAIRLEEICAWVPRIRECNPNLTVGFSYIIVWGGAESEKGTGIVENIGEIVQATQLAREHKFSYISFKPFLTRYPSGSEVMDPSVMTSFKDTVARIQAAVEEAKGFETGDFKVLESTNLQVLVEGNWRDFTKQPRTCHMTALRQVVSPLGVFHCPGYRGVAKGRIGDTVGNTQEVAKMVSEFDATKECSEITCLYNQANWWVQGLIDSNTDLAQVTPLPEWGNYFL